MEQGSGRGTFDRGDLKEAAGGAGRAMEPLAFSLGFWVWQRRWLCTEGGWEGYVRSLGRGRSVAVMVGMTE
jgi:hypothetical protein